MISIVKTLISVASCSVLVSGTSSFDRRRLKIHYDDLDYRNSYDGIKEPPYMGDDPGFDVWLVLAVIFCSCFVLAVVVSVVSMVVLFIKKQFKISEEDLLRKEENQVYMELDSEEQELYFQSRDYLAENPYVRNELTLSQNLLIQEKGINAWEFMRDPMLTGNELLIVNKYELNFFKKMECSTQTNLPIPTKNDVYYFESKIYSLPNPDTTKISIGIGIRPYPWFRLPGRHAHSVSYDSDGYRRHNQPFSFTNEPPFPTLIEGDVIGVGYRVRSGTIFFTRNGKKVSESKLGGHIKHFKIPNEGQIFPIIGASNLCSIHVNLGQMGFVFIEGQVKKWGFAPLEGSGPAPPAYNKFNSDILLERSEIDENDLSERDSDFPPDFWQAQSEDENDNEFDLNENDKFSYNAEGDIHSDGERITLNSLFPPIMPPEYEDDADDEGETGLGLTRDSELSRGVNEALVLEGAKSTNDGTAGTIASEGDTVEASDITAGTTTTAATAADSSTEQETFNIAKIDTEPVKIDENQNDVEITPDAHIDSLDSHNSPDYHETPDSDPTNNQSVDPELPDSTKASKPDENGLIDT